MLSTWLVNPFCVATCSCTSTGSRSGRAGRLGGGLGVGSGVASGSGRHARLARGTGRRGRGSGVGVAEVLLRDRHDLLDLPIRGRRHHHPHPLDDSQPAIAGAAVFVADQARGRHREDDEEAHTKNKPRTPLPGRLDMSDSFLGHRG